MQNPRNPQTNPNKTKPQNSNQPKPKEPNQTPAVLQILCPQVHWIGQADVKSAELEIFVGDKFSVKAMACKVILQGSD